MTTNTGPVTAVLEDNEDGAHPIHGSLAKLGLGAIGVCYGDIGTSPLYAMKEVFIGHHRLALDPIHIFGVLSLMVWSLIIVVTIKYIFIILRADNRGEGGSLALLALIQRRTGGHRWSRGLVMLGVLATALFFGDCMITPAISVLSAVEGLVVVEAAFAPFVLPIAIAILVGLFVIQSRGTDLIGRFFGPIMTVYFLVLAGLGLLSIIARPDILGAINPVWAWRFIDHDPGLAFLALGSVVLALTGAEALYADMGHFGSRPIQAAWVWLVFPALLLNYAGQAALLLETPSAVQNPFFMMASESWRLPLVILATVATVIASQAVITGAFSVIQQGVQLGLMPRFKIEHTSASARGQIYVPSVNWALMVMVMLLVLMFGESSNLAAAYGIAVTGTMFITTCMLTVLVFRVWNWPAWVAAPVLLVFFAIDTLYFASNLTKVPDGGWFPLLIALIAFTLLTTWSKGRQLMIERLREAAMPIRIFIDSAASSASRVPGTAVFMTSTAEGVPHALLHNLKHNKVLHERVILLTVKIVGQPYWPEEERAKRETLGEGFHRVILRYGFMEEANVPAALKHLHGCGTDFKMMDTSFFLSRQTLLASERPGMMIWREKLFSWMLRNAESAMEFFRLPTNRVVELGQPGRDLTSTPDPAPIIVTAVFARSDQAWLDAMRQAHFPPERNQLAAHCTMFHHLPPSIEDELKHRLVGETRGVRAPQAKVAGLMSLGRGVAYRIVSPELAAVRARLAEAFAGLLTPQDAGGWRPHVTIQNKVQPATAKLLLGQLERDFTPRGIEVVGLATWWYRGGPWEALSRHMFA